MSYTKGWFGRIVWQHATREDKGACLYLLTITVNIGIG
jgi:hypothetical protein